MSEKSEVQNLEGASEATEPLDAAPDAVYAGQVAQGEQGLGGPLGVARLAGQSQRLF